MEHYKTITELHERSGYPSPEHPMISLLTCQELSTCSWGESKFTADFYMIALKKIKSGGILFTFSCSQVVDKALFANTIAASLA